MKLSCQSRVLKARKLDGTTRRRKGRAVACDHKDDMQDFSLVVGEHSSVFQWPGRNL